MGVDDILQFLYGLDGILAAVFGALIAGYLVETVIGWFRSGWWRDV